MDADSRGVQSRVGCSILVGAEPCEVPNFGGVQDVGGHSHGRHGPEIWLLGSARGPFLGLGLLFLVVLFRKLIIRFGSCAGSKHE